MGTRVEFLREEEGRARPLFSIREIGGRIWTSGPHLADAILVLRHQVEVGERRIRREEKPLEWVTGLPLTYGRAALQATAPERDDARPLDVLLSEKTLLAFRSIEDFYYRDENQIRDATGQAVPLTRYRRVLDAGDAEVLVPLRLVLESLSPKLPTPGLDDLTRDFFGEFERFRREYPNWTSLYRRGEVWEKVLFGTPPERVPRRISEEEIDFGLFGRLGQRHYPRIEALGLGAHQLWRMPEKPGGETATVEASVTRVVGETAAEQAALDLARLRIPTKILLARTDGTQPARLAQRLREALSRCGGLREGERYFILLSPPSEAPSSPWHLIKSDPASGEPWLASTWG